MTLLSVFFAARTCVEHIINIRTTLQYIGVSIHGPGYTFGENEPVINISMKIKSKLYYGSKSLSFHRYHESIAADKCNLYHIFRENIPEDILIKHWTYSSALIYQQIVIFW